MTFKCRLSREKGILVPKQLPKIKIGDQNVNPREYVNSIHTKRYYLHLGEKLSHHVLFKIYLIPLLLDAWKDEKISEVNEDIYFHYPGCIEEGQIGPDFLSRMVDYSVESSFACARIMYLLSIAPNSLSCRGTSSLVPHVPSNTDPIKGIPAIIDWMKKIGYPKFKWLKDKDTKLPYSSKDDTGEPYDPMTDSFPLGDLYRRGKTLREYHSMVFTTNTNGLVKNVLIYFTGQIENTEGVKKKSKKSIQSLSPKIASVMKRFEPYITIMIYPIIKDIKAYSTSEYLDSGVWCASDIYFDSTRSNNVFRHKLKISDDKINDVPTALITDPSIYHDPEIARHIIFKENASRAFLKVYREAQHEMPIQRIQENTVVINL
jgi:hypothetical protein